MVVFLQISALRQDFRREFLLGERVLLEGLPGEPLAEVKVLSGCHREMARWVPALYLPVGKNCRREHMNCR